MDGCCDGKHKYEYGRKQSALLAPAAWEYIDCSGMMDYTLQRAWGVKMDPGGSVAQHAWCERKCLKLVSYEGIPSMAPGLVLLCYMVASPATGEPGHTWLVVTEKSGRPILTFESHGGKGPDRRRYDTPVLFDNCCACYELGTLA
jgi:hypothetical protein